MSTSEFAKIYSQKREPITGVQFFLLPLRKGKINYFKLKEKLEGSYNEYIIDEEELQRFVSEGERLYVPEVFKGDSDGEQLVLKTTIDKVIRTPSSLFGNATSDRAITLAYRDFKILLIETTEIHFLILYDEKTERHYLVILGSRANSKNLFNNFNKFLEKIGLFAVYAQLDPDKIDKIRDKLKGELIDTTLENFPTSKISKKRIMGRGFQDEEAYLRDARISSVHQHMFEYIDKRGTKGTKRHVVTLSEDGLVRFYSSITYQDFEWFLRNEIFSHLRQTKKIPKGAPIIAYASPDDIFEEEKE